MTEIIIFDIDGTLVESGCKILEENALVLQKLKKKYKIAICGGGILTKALEQMNNLIYFDYYFTECGCVYHKNMSQSNKLELNEIYKKNIRLHKLYQPINILIKLFLEYISKVDYEISGHFVDLRNGIIYLSCIGMQATLMERERFKMLDYQLNIRDQILKKLLNKAIELKINNDVCIHLGGSVGIGIYPIEFDKTQILDIDELNNYNKIYYFGDKYEKNGNDYEILNHSKINGFKIDNVNQTYQILKNKFI